MVVKSESAVVVVIVAAASGQKCKSLQVKFSQMATSKVSFFFHVIHTTLHSMVCAMNQNKNCLGTLVYNNGTHSRGNIVKVKYKQIGIVCTIRETICKMCKENV